MSMNLFIQKESMNLYTIILCDLIIIHTSTADLSHHSDQYEDQWCTTVLQEWKKMMKIMNLRIGKKMKMIWDNMTRERCIQFPATNRTLRDKNQKDSRAVKEDSENQRMIAVR